jgi:hypothetical protein
MDPSLTCLPACLPAFLPAEALPVPIRFVPQAHGRRMRGPYTAGPNALEHNRGRQFFTSGARDGDLEGFLWADGTQPFGCVRALHSGLRGQLCGWPGVGARWADGGWKAQGGRPGDMFRMKEASLGGQTPYFKTQRGCNSLSNLSFGRSCC